MERDGPVPPRLDELLVMVDPVVEAVPMVDSLRVDVAVLLPPPRCLSGDTEKEGEDGIDDDVAVGCCADANEAWNRMVNELFGFGSTS